MSAPRAVVLPGVFRPRSDTWLLARVACRQPLPAGARVLELCAGPSTDRSDRMRDETVITPYRDGPHTLIRFRCRSDAENGRGA